MRTHAILIYEEFADDVLNHRKNFEVRKNDRKYQVGDCICFFPCQKKTEKVIAHELMKKRFRITYVLSGFGIKRGYVALGIEEITSEQYYKLVDEYMEQQKVRTLEQN